MRIQAANTGRRVSIRLLSDLHLEFMADGASSFCERLRKPECDVLVLAGDIAPAGAGLEGALRRFCRMFPHVVFVAGNHEYYGTDPNRVAGLRESLFHQLPNLYWLENDAATIEGQRFVGCTLWYPPGGNEFWMNDFCCIRGFRPWVYERNAESQAWLQENVEPTDIVVTHMLPHETCVHPKYRGLASNHFFVCDQSRVIAENKPALWLHGHTHESVDTRVGDTRIVANPYGYFGHEVNSAWEAGKVVEI